MRDNQQNAMNAMYQNTAASHFERRQTKTFTIDVAIALAADKTFSVNLHEPLKIDKLSDVYLEAFTTFKAKANTAVANMAFLLKINEFNIQSYAAKSTDASDLFNSLLIPNSGDNAAKVFIHKNKKLNYICSLNPETLSTISGSVTDVDGSAAFAADNSRFIAEFVIVARD